MCFKIRLIPQTARLATYLEGNIFFFEVKCEDPQLVARFTSKIEETMLSYLDYLSFPSIGIFLIFFK